MYGIGGCWRKPAQCRYIDTGRHFRACDVDSVAEVDESHLSDEEQNQMEGEEKCEDPEGELEIDLYLQVEEVQDNLDCESDELPVLSHEYKDVIAKVA